MCVRRWGGGGVVLGQANMSYDQFFIQDVRRAKYCIFLFQLESCSVHFDADKRLTP